MLCRIPLESLAVGCSGLPKMFGKATNIFHRHRPRDENICSLHRDRKAPDDNYSNELFVEHIRGSPIMVGLGWCDLMMKRMFVASQPKDNRCQPFHFGSRALGPTEKVRSYYWACVFHWHIPPRSKPCSLRRSRNVPEDDRSNALLVEHASRRI
jgi:hypothetical protein